MNQSTDLNKNLTDSLQIDDNRNKYNLNNSDDEEEVEDFEQEEDDLTAAILAQSGYANSDPKSDSPNSPPPLPSPPKSNLVSAMKGSREKQGIPAPADLRVKWPGGIYDPPPTAGTLVPRSNAVTVQMRIEKKMNKQKVKGEVKGKGKGKGKGKKGVKKYGGSSNRCFNSIDDDDDDDDDAF